MYCYPTSCAYFALQVRAEAAASAEAFEAEHAAKWAADEEAKQLQEDLEAARESLRRERCAAEP